MRHLMCCPCGAETECEPEDMMLGRVWQCPACKQVTVAVYPIGGGKEWINISPAQVNFHGLLGYDENGDRIRIQE